MTLIDTNVLVDVVTDGEWADWSQHQLDRVLRSGPIVINKIVFSEVSVRFRTVEEVESFLQRAQIDITPIPHQALFVAGKVFTQYRRAGGVRTGVLSDFFIGAHAEIARVPLLTRDAKRYRTYFPNVRLISP